MSKKIWWIIIIVIVVAALVGGVYFYKSWWPQKQAKIDMGLSNNKFPWRDYTQDELNKMYP